MIEFAIVVVLIIAFGFLCIASGFYLGATETERKDNGGRLHDMLGDTGVGRYSGDRGGDYLMASGVGKRDLGGDRGQSDTANTLRHYHHDGVPNPLECPACQFEASRSGSKGNARQAD